MTRFFVIDDFNIWTFLDIRITSTETLSKAWLRSHRSSARRLGCIAHSLLHISWRSLSIYSRNTAPTMPPDDTFVDEPVTPAPVFAYRALKGFIFGSPEDQRDVDDSDKENAPLDKLEISKKGNTSAKAATGKNKSRLTRQQRSLIRGHR